MWIRLKKAYTMNTGKRLPIGKVFNVMKKEGEDLVNNGTAEKYTGPFPPEKLKTEFFKPK